MPLIEREARQTSPKMDMLTFKIEECLLFKISSPAFPCRQVICLLCINLNCKLKLLLYTLHPEAKP